MNTGHPLDKITRREMLRLSAAGVAALQGTALFTPAVARAAPASSPATIERQLYSTLLKTWCDGLIARQILALRDLAFYGGLLCPACALIHGRCGDAVYPLLNMAHSTGDGKYVRAAKLVHEWSEAQVSRPDGSWINDVTLSQWQGITVFHAIALAEALTHHGEVLDAATRSAWTARLAAAARFLHGFISIKTGNVNYPVTATLAFVLCGQVLGEPRYIARGRELARRVMDQFAPDGILFGEGHPIDGLSPKGCRPVDLGYNVEESLPSLALYSLLAGDKPVEQQVVSALKTHMEFQLPDGGWDNSWGTRNYKWSWWGSRTSDGCHPGFLLMAGHDPRFREAARRNVELMAACTHEGLLYGGPDYKAHGDPPCIHHTFTHAKALAAALDRGSFPPEPPRPAIPRDEPYGLRSFPVIGTHLAAIGPWRATATEYDWEYQEHVQAGSGGAGGGHVSGGALSVLYHMKLGPILTASMTRYEMIEASNQQQELAAPHMPLTTRIECAAGDTYTSLNDYRASLSATRSGAGVKFEAHGRLMSNTHKPMEGAGLLYEVSWMIDESGVELRARVIGRLPASASLQFVIPVIARTSELVEQASPHSVRISKPKGSLTVSVDAANRFEPIPSERTFNLVPGFEAVPLIVAMQPGKEMGVKIEAGGA
ncbi:MAG TPA: hypothetical protein VG225_06305 [Terracidiphilus sp.]|jgi:hypothetical protein|nr:hypothetical protein [Terracidiphilus sp.]